MSLHTIIALSITFISIFLISGFSQKLPFRQFLKKIVFPSVALLFFVGVLSACDSTTADELEEEIKKNEALTEEVTAIESTNSALQEEFEAFEEEILSLTEQVSELEEDMDDVKDKNKELSEEIEILEEENESLKSEMKKLEKKLKEKEVAAASSGTSSGASNTSETASKDTSSEKTKTEEPKDCDIKGSENGIYHVPGSTYYSRTKNVEQWFCSTEEAEKAGYRAPKR